jgi:hypothetical protein
VHNVADGERNKQRLYNFFLNGNVAVKVFADCGEDEVVHESDESTNMCELDDRD